MNKKCDYPLCNNDAWMEITTYYYNNDTPLIFYYCKAHGVIRMLTGEEDYLGYTMKEIRVKKVNKKDV